MRRIALLCAFALLSGCSILKGMLPPPPMGLRPESAMADGKPLSFEDGVFKHGAIEWRSVESPTGYGVAFELKNSGSQSIKIPWDEVVIVDVNGESERVMHSGVKFISRDQPIPPSIVPAGGRLTDEAVPTSNVHYSSGKYASGWQTTYLSSNVADAGKRVSLLLPVVAGEKRTEYLVTFSLFDPRPLTKPAN